MGVRQPAATLVLRFLTVLAFVAIAIHPASAQSVYVAGALGADITLASGQESIGLSVPTGGGEAWSGAARLGVLLEPRWGIELDVSRAGEIRETSRTGPIPLPLGIARPTLLPEIEFRRRVTTISATASIRQQVSDNVALAYLGGVVFHRTDARVEYGNLRGFTTTSGVSSIASFRFTPPTPPGEPISPIGIVLPSLFPPSLRIETVQYGAGPVVGFEAHIGYGEHFLIIPGIRMHGLPATWLVRPSIAAGWSF
jgi:hypothetical protein